MAARGTKRGAARKDLVETALRLFDRHGFHAVGIDRILAEAGVAKMTLYHHFASKEALIEAVLARRDLDFREAFMAAIPAGEPGARLLAVFDAIEGWVRDPGFRGSLFDKAAAEYGEKDHPVRRSVLAHKAWLFAELRRLAAEANVSDPLKLAAELFLLMEGAIGAAAATGDRSAPRRAREAARTLIAAATTSGTPGRESG